jgi:hypothetical protein
MKRIKTFIIMIFFPILIMGWKESTHILLSRYACINSRLINNDLIWKFNLDMGADHYLTVGNVTKTVAGWIYYGADKEDYVTSRSFRHFHNPILFFNSAGLIDYFGIKHTAQVLWAQDGEEQKENVEGDMSWGKIQQYYYYALISDTEEKRNLNFGLMFKGLGHQIHLIQDMGNPEHTRNDNHLLPAFESWLEKWTEKNKVIIEGLCSTPIFPDVDLQTTVFDESTQKTLVPISRLSDADVYNPANPIPSISNQQGLAEYSNSNFVSDDTVFSPDFPFPRLSGLDKKFPQMITDYVPDEKGLYASRKKEGEGEKIDHFVRASYLQKWIEAENVFIFNGYWLDETCYKDYVYKLIPRSVGYSAALLDYFFRGEIEITLPNSSNSIPPQLDGIYAFTNDGNLGFRYIILNARNISKNNRNLTYGNVTLVVSYRKCEGDPFVASPPDFGVKRYFIKVDYPKIISIPRDEPILLDFDLASNPLPVNAVDITLTLVFGDRDLLMTDPGLAFQGVALGFKDISEPTPIDLFNNTDRVCFNGKYVSYDDTALWDAVDINPKNGTIDCSNNAEIDITQRRIKPIYVSFNGSPATSSNYYFKYENGLEILPGETPHRFFILADEYPAKFNCSVLVHSQSMENPLGCLSYYLNNVSSFDSYTNKLIWVSSPEPGGDYFYPLHSPIGYFRGFPFWIIQYFENSTVPTGSACSMSTSRKNSSSAESSNTKLLGVPQIIAVGDAKKKE